ncbi:predicted hydrolase [Bellilinea caldifistulae]|uniref:alpha/beta fold hydrolase n=1 Tax=Bellilinea caldifistulae TaxID=360411 RepID=UPI000783F98D|nr:alpha/beta hydrolase [Bellilinea caldifistulae]GAP11679.1 predicted hydrolase [Bellilinea caldifistulae]
MPHIRVNNLDHYYEQTGQGAVLVFVHGAFADARIWEPQWKHFSTKYQLLRYDLRGHGRTGASDLAHYSMATYADDLSALLDALAIRSPILCGLSWGGSIAQTFAVRNPERPRALILAGTAVSIDLTMLDKLLCYVLFPRWMMSLTIRMMSVENFTRFSFRLARLTRGKHWLSRDENAQAYLEQCMLRMEKSEYLKIWNAMYGFHTLPLEKITCPTLILNGEFEPKNTFRHTEEILRRIPQAKARIIPCASHAMNLEQAETFNNFVDAFLDGAG